MTPRAFTASQHRLLEHLSDRRTVVHVMNWGTALFNPRRWPEVVDAPMVHHRTLAVLVRNGLVRTSRVYRWMPQRRPDLELSPLGRRMLKGAK